ncbi:vanadium-dependent haloperoxidase [Methylobacterium nonmethylotrophicum]|nr:vanadium-dependent haloperoxidase [Methylobacterium nonmethylotrophicum]
MTTLSRTRLLPLVMATCAMAVATMSAQADIVMDWNAKADAIAADKQLGPSPHGRNLALLHTAIFEAVNAVQGRYAPYRLSLVTEPDASDEAAAAKAGHDILVALYPDQKESLNAMLVRMLAGLDESIAKTKGIELGKRAASGMLAERKDDGSDAPENYRPHTAPGSYVPTTIPLYSNIGRMKPWVMTSGAQFRPSPPPALTSETWTRDYNEIRELGARNSTVRTPEQTSIGRFWVLAGARSYNPILRQVAMAKDMDLLDCARLYALTAMAGSDAQIAVFEAKYTYGFWRPITAIRNGDLGGNPATPRDGGWLPLSDTPLHPEYPCAHCITSSAVATVLTLLVGNEVGELSLTSVTAPGVVRKWTRLSDYADEAVSARIYAGFHYRFSGEVGQAMGRQIGELTVRTQLRPRLPSVEAAR